MPIYELPDIQYLTHAKDILEQGGYAMDRTGTGTLKQFGKMMSFRPAEQFPLLTSKKVAFEALKGELFWIYQDQSNDVNLLREKYGVRVWNEWAGEDGSIGKAYGFQVKKHNQTERLIEGLKKDPQSRRHRIQLWSEEDAHEMNLEPCAFLTMWDVDPITDELNMTLIQRSGDWFLGIPFNMAQYALLQILVAHCAGLKVGTMHHFINNGHIYVNHINQLRKQLKRSTLWNDEKEKLCYGEIVIDTDETDFMKINWKDIKLEKYVSHKGLKGKVSV